ncbi:MAG: hypothetical protein C0600_11215 [Ignavibacteria bacterium]|nr:MAG: hypothetical protein C0600_11215 [Ignavibacteria bacterium]
MKKEIVGSTLVWLSLLLAIGGMKLCAQERNWEVLTLFGGNRDSTTAFGDTNPFALAYDEKRDRIIIAGLTFEPDLPTTANAIKRTKTDMMDGFIAVFNSDCSEVIYCSYIGGTNNDAVADVVVLDDDRVLVALSTYSQDIPTTGTAWLSTAPGYHTSWFGVLSLETFELIHAGFFGGSNTESDAISRAMVLQDGSLLMTGAAASTDLPVTDDAFQKEKKGSDRDAFIAIFDSSFALTFCSYHGGADDTEDAFGGVVETENYLVFTGNAYGEGMPVTMNAHQDTFGGGWLDAYMVVISKESRERVYSTYLGGDDKELMQGLLSLGNDRIALVGGTSSKDFPITPNAWQSVLVDTNDWSTYDAIIAVFDLKSMSFEQMSFFGGNSSDFSRVIIRGSNDGSVFLPIETASYEFPLMYSKSDSVTFRCVLVSYNTDTYEPLAAVPLIEVTDSSIKSMLRTEGDRILYCGRTTRYSRSKELPVRSTGHRTKRAGSDDVYIATVYNRPVSVDALSEATPSLDGLSIHPQPAREALHFVLNSSEDATVMLYDLLGRCIRETRVHSNGQGVHGLLRLGGVPPGVYLLVARTKTDISTRKVVVTR